MDFTLVRLSFLPEHLLRSLVARPSTGKGSYSATVTINNNGTVIRVNDFGTYTVNADCTGKSFSETGGGTVEFVLVDGGKEAYFLQTDPSGAVFLFTVAKKQFPDDDEESSLVSSAKFRSLAVAAR